MPKVLFQRRIPCLSPCKNVGCACIARGMTEVDSWQGRASLWQLTHHMPASIPVRFDTVFKHYSPPRPSILLLLPLLLAPMATTLFTGCKDKEEIQVYRVSKAEPESLAPEASPAESAAPNAMPDMAVATAPADQPAQITGNPPANWAVQPLSAMRQASYLVKGDNGATADISLVILDGPAGGVLENVNRWLSQLGQPPITDDKLAQMGQHVTSGLGDVMVVDLEGLPARRFFSKYTGMPSSRSRRRMHSFVGLAPCRPVRRQRSPPPSAPLLRRHPRLR